MPNTSTEKIPFWQSYRFQRIISMGRRYLIAVFLILFAVLPALWVISSSLNPAKSLVGGTLWPKNPGFTNYIQLLNNEFFPYQKWLLNSLKIAGITSMLTMLITCTTGYALSRFRFEGRRTVMTAILILNIFPSILAMVALFATMQQFGHLHPLAGIGYARRSHHDLHRWRNGH